MDQWAKTSDAPLEKETQLVLLDATTAIHTLAKEFSPGRPLASSTEKRSALRLQPVIELAGLRVRFGKRDILKELTVAFTAGPSACWAQTEPGSPPSSRLCSVFVRVTAGTAKVFGHDISREMNQVRALVGYMPENDSFIANQSAVSFVRMMGNFRGCRRRRARTRS